MRQLGLRTLHWQKTDDSLVRLADGSWLTMAAARAAYPDFDLTRSWNLPDVPVLPEDEDLGSYLRRLGFTDDQLFYTKRSFANAVGDDPSRISARYALTEMHDSSAGEGDFRILDGYDHLLNTLAAGLDIHLNTEVIAVDWHGDAVRVQTAGGEWYEADRAVITLPLGVLQAGDVTFTPELPAAKQNAIADMLMGPGLKMIYRFEEAILPADIGAIYSAHNPPMWWSPSFGRGITDYQVWTAFATGDWARELLALGEAGALQQGVNTLRHELNRPDITPTAAHLMNWVDEPFTRGAYSVIPPGKTGLREQLAEPVNDRLFWAGEATAPDAWAATVHGAYYSGRQVASAIMTKRGL